MQQQSQDSTMMRSDDGRNGTLSDEMVLMRMHRINQMEIKAGHLAEKNGSSTKVKQFGTRLARDHAASDQKVTALAQRLGITLGREGMDSTGNKGMYRRGVRGQRADSTQRGDSSYRRGMHGMDTTQNRTDTTYRQNRADTSGQAMNRGEMQGDSGRAEMRERAQFNQLMNLRGAAFDTAFANLMVQGHEKAISMLERAQNQTGMQNQSGQYQNPSGQYQNPSRDTTSASRSQAQDTTQNPSRNRSQYPSRSSQTQTQITDVRTLITATLPVLREHLRIAQSLGGTSARTTSSTQ
jgi:predicted outer membrane protein